MAFCFLHYSVTWNFLWSHFHLTIYIFALWAYLLLKICHDSAGTKYSEILYILKNQHPGLALFSFIWFCLAESCFMFPWPAFPYLINHGSVVLFFDYCCFHLFCIFFNSVSHLGVESLLSLYYHVLFVSLFFVVVVAPFFCILEKLFFNTLPILQIFRFEHCQLFSCLFVT